jgi:hypothetical protein
MDDIFNGLLNSGFSIQRVHQAPYYQEQHPEAQPGSWAHQRMYVGKEFTVVVMRNQRRRRFPRPIPPCHRIVYNPSYHLPPEAPYGLAGLNQRSGTWSRISQNHCLKSLATRA